jgi:hypothetical protein
MRYLLPLLFLVACGTPIDESPGVSSSELADTVSYLASNGSITLPSPADYFCHPTKVRGSGAHSQAIMHSWGIPSSGGTWAVSGQSAFAIPNDPQNIGSASMNVQCDRWFLFHGNSSAGMTPGATLAWPFNGTFTGVSGSANAYYKDSVCWLSRVSSVSHAQEKVWIDDTSNPWVYVLNAQGFNALSTTAACAWLGRPLAGQQWLTATAASSPFSTYGSYNSSAAQKGVCLIMSVDGNLDDGTVEVIPGTQMRLRVLGGVTKATALCLPY